MTDPLCVGYLIAAHCQLHEANIVVIVSDTILLFALGDMFGRLLPMRRLVNLFVRYTES